MNKVLITGNGVGNDFGVCGTCNLNFSWLVTQPSTLIWADKIIITKGAWESQIKNNRDKQNKAINRILQIAKDNNIIEIIDVGKLYKKEMSEEILSLVENDLENMVVRFPQNIKKAEKDIDGDIVINGKGYCGPYVSSIYASMELAKSLDANCLFSERDYEYLKFKFGVDNRIITKSDSMDALNEIFNIHFPNELVLHNFAFTSDKTCCSCSSHDECNDRYLEEIEKNTVKIIEWRQYDEIYRAKEEIEKIIKIKYQLPAEINPKEIQREFREKQIKINKNINRVFPVIKRWTNMVTVLATPLSIYSAAVGNKEATIVASGALGIAKATDEFMKYYENKNKWVGFINKNIIS